MESGQSWSRVESSRTDNQENAEPAAAPAKAKARVLAYPTARVAGTLISAIGCAFVNWVCGWFLAATLARDGVLNVTYAAYAAALGLGSTAFFVAQTSLVGALDGYAQGRTSLAGVQLPEADANSVNPWVVGLAGLAKWGVAIAAVSGWAVVRLWPGGMTIESFTAWFGALSAPIAGVITWQLMGRTLLGQIGVPATLRRYQGSFARYLWLRHALPHALLNVVMNGWVGLSFAPESWSDRQRLVPLELVQSDAIGTAFFLLLLIAAGVRVQVRFDRRWGVIAQHPKPAPGALARIAVFLGWTGAVAAISCGLAALAPAGLDGRVYVFARAVICGVLCAPIAYWGALWTAAEPEV